MRDAGRAAALRQTALCQRCVSDLGRWGGSLFPRGRGGPAKPRSPPGILGPRLRGGTRAAGGRGWSEGSREREWCRRRSGAGAGVVGEWRAYPQNATTPAKAGAQLGDVGNGGSFSVTTAIPIGPRPSPGWVGGIGASEAHAPRPPVGHGEAAPYGRAPSCRPVDKAKTDGVSFWPCPPTRSSRSTASFHAARCRSSRSDAPAPACAPPSARAGPRGCRG